MNYKFIIYLSKNKINKMLSQMFTRLINRLKKKLYTYQGTKSKSTKEIKIKNQIK